MFFFPPVLGSNEGAIRRLSEERNKRRSLLNTGAPPSHARTNAQNAYYYTHKDTKPVSHEKRKTRTQEADDNNKINTGPCKKRKKKR